MFESFSRSVFICKAAISACPLSANPGGCSFSPTQESEDNGFSRLRGQIRKMKTMIEALDRDPVIVIVWMQGEADLGASEAAAYKANWEALMSSLAAYDQSPDYVVMGLLNDNAGGTRTTVHNAQELWVTENPTIAASVNLSLYALGGDALHFDVAEAQLIGVDYGDAILNFFNRIECESGGGYSAEARIAINYLNSDLPTAYKNAIATFVDAEVTAGNWKGIKCIYAYGLTAPNSLIDFKAGRVSVTNNGPTHDSDGYTFDGSNDYIDSKFWPTSTAVTGTDVIFGIYCKTNNVAGSSQTSLGGVIGSGNLRFLIRQVGDNSRIFYNVNSTTTGTYNAAAFTNDSYYTVLRSGANFTRVTKNGVTVDDENIGGGSANGTRMFIGATSNTGTPENYFNGTIGCFVIMRLTHIGNLTTHHANIATLIAALSAL